ncbi:MAG TPA: hypothetical protein P5235_04975 [Saprospiraceae bacterium]|mgnify:CR=1 FL=1|nr:hypothetical protein [Lewinellaceae bacterium]HRX28715.1 hypothetical protein [Saprospiraceae bacterium]
MKKLKIHQPPIDRTKRFNIFRITILFFLPFNLLTITSCCDLENPGSDKTVMALRPIYDTHSFPVQLDTEEDLKFQKINASENYLTILEYAKGLKVYKKNTNGGYSFYSQYEVPAVSFTYIKDDILYCDNGANLIRIDLKSQEITKLEDQYEIDDKDSYPNNYYGSFECYDASKGTLLDWEYTEIFYPKCWRHR